MKTFFNFRNRLFLILIYLLGSFVASSSIGQEKKNKNSEKEKSATRWEKAIASFEKQDKNNPPQTGGVLFLGSSSIRMWKLKKWFPDLNCLNRGFGGSEISDSNYFFDRLVVPYQPKTVVFYAGDNDIAKGKSPQTVLNDFKKFAAKVKKALPQTQIVFVAIKPSLSRWKLVDKMRNANRLIQQVAKEDPKITFADIDSPMIGKDGKPRKELFLKDGLHLNEAGYQVWFDVIGPMVK